MPTASWTPRSRRSSTSRTSLTGRPRRPTRRWARPSTPWARTASRASTPPTTAWPHGIITALNKQAIKVPVGGQDSELAGLQRILKGDQAFTIYKQIKPEAETTAEIAVRLLKGEKFDDLTPTKVDSVSGAIKGIPAKLYDAQVVTKENVADTIIADKVYKASEICTPEYKAACEAAGIK